MAGFDYAGLEKTVTNIMTKFGAPNCRVLRAVTNVTDTDKPWRGMDGEDEVIVSSCTVLLGGMSRLHIGGPTAHRGKGQSSEVYEDSTVFMAAADGAKARPGDYLEVPLLGGGNDRLAIKDIAPLKPGGVNLMWQIELEC